MRKGAVKMDADQRQELGRSYRRGIRKGLFKIMSKMGISTIASYRSAQLFEIVGLSDEVVSLCFEGSDSRIQGADFSDLKADARVSGAARLGSDRDRRAGRTAQVHARRRIPHVQPGRDRHAASGGDVRRLRRSTSSMPRWSTSGRCPASAICCSSSRTRRPIPIEEVEPVDRHPQAFRQRRHVARRPVAGGARGAGHRHEPLGRALQLRRGRRGSGRATAPRRTPRSSRWPRAASA